MPAFPGCSINALAAAEIGSLCCFVSKNDQHLYALTAAHCVGGEGSAVQLADNSILGTVSRKTNLDSHELDSALIQVADHVARDIQGLDLSVQSHGVVTPLTGVVSLNNHPSAVGVIHAGHTCSHHAVDLVVGAVDLTVGTVGNYPPADRARLTLTGRPTNHGDSGGPVFTPDGLLVGFVSIGLTGGATRIMHAETVMHYFGVTLATIANSAQWRPPAPPPGPDPFAGDDPFAGGGVMNAAYGT